MTMVEVDPLTTFPLAEIMDSIETVERSISDRVIVYRWRPVDPQLENGVAVVYNLIGETPHTQADIYHEQDDLVILARCGVRHSDAPDEMGMVEKFAPLFMQRIDSQLKRIHPLGTTAVKKAWRNSFRMLEDSFNDIPVLAVEFPLVFTIHRQVMPNS